MEFLKYTILTIVFVCTMPAKRGNMLKNDVTPAPTLDFTGFLGKTGDCQEQSNQDQNIANTAQDIELGPVLVKTAEIPYNENLEDLKSSLTHTKLKMENMPKQPVCKYGVAEIFLFRASEAVGWDGNVSKRTATAMSKEELADSWVEENAEEEKKSKDDEDNESHVNLEISDMQSFEEWKNLKLQEQESRLADSEPTPVHKVRAKKTQVNYASQDCGAKVLAHNQEAKHVSAILDENKDMYMLNPCSTEIWFVIELCEPIQVQQLQLGNLELFSSQPKEFSVSISERYPAREWHSIGTFEAPNERKLQTFVPKGDGQMFAKYIKFEMLSHFSNEHFCPLTLVRVLGVSMVDEFDEPEQLQTAKEGDMDVHVITQRTDENAVVDEESDGPINTVLNIVKTAMGHVLNNGGDKDGRNKVAEPKINNSEGFQSNETEAIDFTAESEVILVTNETEVAGPRENSTQSLITLIKTGNGEDLSEYLKNFTSCSSAEIPLYIPKFLHSLAPKLNVNMCWFLEFFCKVSLAGCLVHYPYNYSAIGLFIPMGSASNYLPLLQTNNLLGGTSEDAYNATGLLDETLKLEEVRTDFVIGSEQEDDVVTLGQIDDATPSQPVVEQTQSSVTNSKQQEDTEDFIKTPPTLESDTSTIPVPENQIASGESNRGSVDGQDDLSRDAPETDTGSAIVQPGIADDGNATAMNVTSQDDAIATSSSETEANETQLSGDENLMVNPTTNGTKSTTNSTISDNPTTNQPQVVINPGTNQKDSVFMRLSNRIRVLEQNMSLSSDYLENLSQRYKKQMDEMQRAFNQTTSKLLTTGRTANENDARQTELIHQTQTEIAMLKQRIQNLSFTHDQLNMQLVERHLCLIALEIIVFLAVLVTCLGRRMAQVRLDLQRSEALIENLESIIHDLRQDSPRKANGHCAAIPFDSINYHPPATSAMMKHSKRQKRRSHKHRDNLKIGTSKFEPSLTRSSDLYGVEEIGNKTGGDNPMLKNSNEKHHSWNGNPLAPKPPNGHIKGRK